jgi:hypothetical protein
MSQKFYMEIKVTSHRTLEKLYTNINHEFYIKKELKAEKIS